jgi:hypothetical protein
LINRGVQLLLAGAGVILVAGMAHASSTPKTAIRAATIKGAGAQITGNDLVTGACDTTGYDATCPSGNCQCFEIPTAKITGSMAGVGTADVRVTADQGDITTDNTTTNGECIPLYGVAHVTSTLNKSSLTEDLNIIGALCKNFSPNGNEYIDGGFGIQDGATNSAHGWGTVTGTSTNSKTSPTVTLHLRGPITQ